MQVVQLIISGLAQGCVYGLVALSFVLIYKATETVSFAQGDFMMLGAFCALILLTTLGFPYWLGIIVSVLAIGLLGVAVERGLVKPILGQPAFSIIMLTIGLGYVARSGITMIPGFGWNTHVLKTPYTGVIFRFGAFAISAEQVVAVLATSILCALLYVLFRYNRVGIAMQAASQNQLAAYCMGIPVGKLNSLIWGLAAAVAALAGILLAPMTFVYANMGFIGLKAFPAAVVGGFGSLPGAIVGGVIIGIVESLSGFYLPEGVKDIAAYIVVLVMLMVMPNGLFGENLRKKV